MNDALPELHFTIPRSGARSLDRRPRPLYPGVRMWARPEQMLDASLRGVGMVVWLVVGSPVWIGLFQSPHDAAERHFTLWATLYLGFAIAFVVATAPDRGLPQRRRLLLLQSLLALALASLGMPHFEGALFALVAAQTPTVLRPATALAWDLAQALVLVPILVPTHGVLGTAKAVGEYSVFAAFALAVLVLRQREAAARSELARAHGALLATQSLLADDARIGERLRIAREMHDALGHGLTAASLHLQLAARAGGAQEPIAAAQEAVRSTLAEVRGLVRAAREDTTVDLRTALRALCVGIREPQIHLRLSPSLRSLDAARAHVLFRCIQEALTNALRHASARNVWIDVAFDGALSATVRDDGVGAAKAAPAFGSGLEGVRERLEAVGGVLAIESATGGGLTFRVDIPVTRERA